MYGLSECGFKHMLGCENAGSSSAACAQMPRNGLITVGCIVGFLTTRLTAIGIDATVDFEYEVKNVG